MLGYPIGKPFGTARIVFVWAFVLASVLLLREPDDDWSHYGGDWLEFASAMGRKAVIALHLAVFFAFTAFLSRSGVLHGRAVGLEMAELQDTKDKLHYLVLGSVDIHLSARKAATRWMAARKELSVLS